MLIYDIIPPEKIKKFTKEKVLGIKNYKTKSRKYLAFGWRTILLFFIVLYFVSGITPITFFQKSIRAISQEEKTINFYATLCAGNWQNPQNAQGQPEVGPTGDINSFSETNSAVYKSGLLNLVCQNFIIEEQETSGVRQGVEVEGEQATSTLQEATTTEATTSESTSFFEKTKNFFGSFKAQAQEENIKLAKIKFSFSIGEKTPEILSIDNQATSTQLQTTTSESETNSTSSEQPTSFWNKLKNLFGALTARAEENEQNATNSEVISEIELPIEEEEETTTSEAVTSETTSTTATTTEMSEIEPPTEEATTTEAITTATTTEAATTATSTFQETTTTTTDETVIGIATTTETLLHLDEKIIIWYSLDGELWGQLGTISSSLLSNALNSGYFEYDAPFLKNWEDVKNLKIKFEGVIGKETNVTAFLDSVWVEVEYQQQEITEEEQVKKLPKIKIKENSLIFVDLEKEDFRSDEEPIFIFTEPEMSAQELISAGMAEEVLEGDGTETIQNSTSSDQQQDEEQEFLEKVGAFLKKGIKNIVSRIISKTEAQVNSITVKIFDPKGQESSLAPQIVSHLVNGKERFKIKLPKPERGFKPGVWKIEIELETDQAIFVAEQDFSWGVLAINTNKSIFLPNETAYLQMAVLNDTGLMVCDANLTLEIFSPEGEKTILKTSDGTIIVNPECRVHGVTEKPDYEAYFAVDGIGEYLMTLTAITQSGTRSITDSFKVQDSVPFDIERQGPTRILPTEPYTMKFIIKVNQNLNGIVREVVPESFDIQKTELFLIDTGIQSGTTSQEFDEEPKVEVSIEPFQIIIQEDKKIINWTARWQRNQIYELSYQFDAPDISPYFYLLGPLQIGDFQETRGWQIAADSPGQFGRPDSTISSVNWSASGTATHHEATDEVTPNGDTDYVYTIGVDEAEIQLGLSDVTAPATNTGNVIRITAFAPLGGSATEKVYFLLYQGVTEICTSGKTIISRVGYTTYAYTLTTAEADSITDYTDLRLHVHIDVIGVTEEIRVTQVELEVPEVPANNPPQVDSVSLNASSSIPLIENSTTSVLATATATDPNGYTDISTTTGKIYRSGVTEKENCDPSNANNCYEDALCATSSCASNSCIVTCTFYVWFYADPTDILSPSSSEAWVAWIQAIDSQNQTGSATNSTEVVDIYTLRALNVTESISYETIDAGSNTGSFNPTTTVTNTGNSAIDLALSGADLCTDYATCTENTIGVSNQEYSTSSFTYGAGIDLYSSTSTIDVDLSKPTFYPSTSTDIIYWGLGVPGGTPGTPIGIYTGENLFTATSEQ